MTEMLTMRQLQPRCPSSLAQRQPHRVRATQSAWMRLPLGNSKRCVAVHGILDKWRQDKGIPTSEPGSNATVTLVQPKPSKQTAERFHSSQASDDDDDVPCPVECVTEVFTAEELQQALDDAGDKTLVVVDFFKTACGACKFIYPGFVKLCQASAAGKPKDPPVVFLKHNVYDDDEEQVTDLCKKYNVRSVPKFIFFKAGQQVDSFSTRDKDKVAVAILKHAEPGSVEFGDWQPPAN